ncbi:hypothetical protein [Geodermatophilus chilensis]|uniref:hypothetical protein n=1 Tax=Geodermatophilus chilensis TaxID=2035835 RepID=UPI0013000DE5|nr:hypothetical protein [Geodermatophilus chilensis]
MRAVSWAVATLTLVASGGYALVYVYRWEWHRALLVGLIFLAALIGSGTALVLRRLGRLERRVAQGADRAPPTVLHRLRSAPVESPPFRWLRPPDPDRSSVFIPFLIGGGVLLSAVAWLVERVAGAAARTGIEEELADRLREVAFPAAPLVPSAGEVLAGCAGPEDAGLRVLLGPSAGTPG